MKQILKVISFALALLFGGIEASASEPIVLTPDPAPGDGSTTNPPDEVDPNKEKDNNTRHRHKCPMAPIVCEIDFENQSISAPDGFLESVVEFQAWDVDGNICLISSPTPSLFVSALFSLPSDEYLIIFITPSSSFNGNLFL